MSDLETISFKLEPELLNQLKAVSGNAGMSEFIRKAIKKEMNIEELEVKEFAKSMKKLSSFNITKLEQTIADTEIKIHFIFERMEKLNELIKVIYRRTTLGANFSKHTIDELKQSRDFSNEAQEEIVKRVQNEIKEIEN